VQVGARAVYAYTPARERARAARATWFFGSDYAAGRAQVRSAPPPGILERYSRGMLGLAVAVLEAYSYAHSDHPC
jgi:hypothetical protein